MSTYKKTTILLCLTGVVCFIALGFVNALGAQNERMLFIVSQDESFQYPFLVRMLTPGQDIGETLKHLVSYQHYIYGYPFYVISALAVLPSRLIYGEQFAAQVSLNLLLLRQLVSVLPMLLAILIFVYLQTRFTSTIRAGGLFLLLVFIPGVVRQNITWWHPDASAILSIALTFYFLNRDRLRFGRNFVYAALACGMAISIKQIGVFFFLAVALYLLMGFLHERGSNLASSLCPDAEPCPAPEISNQNWKSSPWIRLVGRAILFFVIMAVTVMVTNPLLFVPETRDKIIQTRIEHNELFTQGWDSSAEYHQGPLSWLPVFEHWYGQLYFLAFALVTLIYGCMRGQRRFLNVLILAWVIPYSLYVFFFIAVRPDHYWLPIMLPLLSAILAPLDHRSYSQDDPFGHWLKRQTPGFWEKIAQIPARINHISPTVVVTVVILAAQLFQFLTIDYRLYDRALTVEKYLTACDSTPINQPDGQGVVVKNTNWYAIESYDLLAPRPWHHFDLWQAPLIVFGTPQHGTRAWACQGEEQARFWAQRTAEDTRITYPNHRIFGPDGNEITTR